MIYPSTINVRRTNEFGRLEIVSGREAEAVYELREQVLKRSLIPSDRLPEGWEVERLACGDYKVNSPHCKIAVYCRAGMDIYDLLRHIDPEASNE